MTAGEFGFLALGLVLGLFAGAGLIEIIRARPPTPREVRLTVAHDAIPRRSTTLADDAFTSVGAEPARGGPADRRSPGTPLPVDEADRRTTVRLDPATTQLPSGSAATGEMVGIPISSGDDPVLKAIHESPDRPLERLGLTVSAMTLAGRPDPVPQAARETAGMTGGGLTAVGLLERPPDGSPTSAPVATGRCAEERRVADERCELAVRARARAVTAADALRLAQRSYDEHEAAAVTASWQADPRAIHEAKDAAQGGFRSAVGSAQTPDQLETAARGWLQEINRINTEARDATARATRERAAAATIAATLERLGLEADAARIGAENADVACLAARVAVADCEEEAATRPAKPPPPPEDVPLETPHLDDDETLGIALETGGAPRIFRLLRGDRPAMTSLVAALAGEDPTERRRWQLLMTSLIEAIIADAIEASALEFPLEHPFWTQFTRTQNREIAHALSSLGYRFDGLGGWADDRHPSQRDLTLALGYAGLDPKRVRQMPTGEEIAGLYRLVSVAADEYLAQTAGDLTLFEMVTLLGRRADSLAEVWNDWGRIRPLLLDDA